jgi:serine/threonine-protein kinase
LGVEGYAVSDELGRGAQGIVYRATPDDGGRDVALKILRPEASDEQLQRFDEAIDTMEGLRGVKGVVQLITRGKTGLGAPYFAMDLVRGPSLRSVLNRGRLSPRQLVRLLVDVAYAAHRAHDRGVVHRDLKPENILIEEGPSGMVPHVADFGLARDLTQGTPRSTAGGLGGTPAYTAPEQVLGNPVSRRTDVHALGSILYELITGSPPFQGTNVATTIHAVATQTPRRPAVLWTGLPKPLEDIALRALAKEPNDRYPTAATFAQQIQSALEGSAVGKVPTRRLQRPGLLRKKFVQGVQRRSLFLKGLAVGLTLGAAAGALAGSLVV